MEEVLGVLSETAANLWRHLGSTGQLVEGHIQFAAGLQFGDRAIKDLAAFIDQHDAVGHGFHFLKNVGREQNGFGFAQAAHRIADFANLMDRVQRSVRPESARRLVQQRLCHANALAKTFGKLADGFLLHTT